MEKIIFIHGFNSIQSDDDIKWLKENFKNIEIICPVLNYTDITQFNKDLTLIEDILCSSPKDDFVLIGKSLGCLVCEYLANKYQAYSILINPSIYPKETLKKYTKLNTIENFRTKQKKIVDSEFINNILEKTKTNRVKFNSTVFICKNDEKINIKNTVDELSKYYDINIIDGEHSIKLTNIPLLKEKILFGFTYFLIQAFTDFN